MKTLVLTLAIIFGASLAINAQSVYTPLKTTHSSYTKLVDESKNSKTVSPKKNKKRLAHMQYKELNKRDRRNTPFTFARQKPKNPQNSYSFNW